MQEHRYDSNRIVLIFWKNVYTLPIHCFNCLKLFNRIFILFIIGQNLILHETYSNPFFFLPRLFHFPIQFLLQMTCVLQSSIVRIHSRYKLVCISCVNVLFCDDNFVLVFFSQCSSFAVCLLSIRVFLTSTRHVVHNTWVLIPKTIFAVHLHCV